MPVNVDRDLAANIALDRRRLELQTLAADDAVLLDSAMAPPPLPPYWAGWDVDITFHDASAQQEAWAREALQECTYPLQALAVKIDVHVGAFPTNADSRHPYMVTQMTSAYHANIYVQPWADDPAAPEMAGLAGGEANIKEFYKESFVHELGHVAIWSTVGTKGLASDASREDRQAAFAALFFRNDTNREGTLSDWDDFSLAWADEVQEAAAEVFKCSFYSERRHLLYKNRTNWHIGEPQWKSFLTLLEPGRFAVDDSPNIGGGPLAPIIGGRQVVGQVRTQWFMGGSVFRADTGNIYYDPALWVGGEALQRFHSLSPFIDEPPDPPSDPITGVAHNHGWGVDDTSKTWATGSITGFGLQFRPPDLSFSRKGYAELVITHQGRRQNSVGITIEDETGHAWGSIGYNYAFTPPGFNTLTAYAVALAGSFPPGIFGVPLEPPCKLFIELDADAGTATAGVKDLGGAVITQFSITTWPRTHVFRPYMQAVWDLLGDDPQFPPAPGNEYSELDAGPCSWTTYPTPIDGPYPFKPPGVVPGPVSGGILRVG